MRSIDDRVRALEALTRGIPSRFAGGRVQLPTRITIGRGNTVYTASGAYDVYGCKAGFNPTAVSAGMWNGTTKEWIPADDTWDDGICYGYLGSGDVVAVATKFDGVSGNVGNDGALVEGSVIYSQRIKTYDLGADTLTIYLVDEF